MTPQAMDDVRRHEQADLDAACEQACRAIAPAWPLDRAVAVNPHWARIGMPVRQVAARMAVLGNIRVFPSRAMQRQAWDQGRIALADLEQALAMQAPAREAGLTAAHLLAALREPLPFRPLPLPADILDDAPRRDTRLSWRPAIVHQISLTCASYFDTLQAEWQPAREQGLYGFWRATLRHDRGTGMMMGLPGLRQVAEALPRTRRDAEHRLLERLQLPPEVWADYLEASLLTVNGWASWCAYLRSPAAVEERRGEHLRDLLAIRLAWDAILLESQDAAVARQAIAALQNAWRQAPAMLQRCEQTLLVDETWQLALEIGYQRQLAAKLTLAPAGAMQPCSIQVQAAFCIDVRSEPMRRALENVQPSIQTFGFAGSFGLPAAYTPIATTARRPQLPGLLAPTLEVSERTASSRPGEPGTNTEAALDELRRARTERFALSGQWLAASRWPGATFSFVEAAGLGYLAKLGQWLRPPAHRRTNDDLAGIPVRLRLIARPGLQGLDLDARAALAARVLHAMGLDHDIAPLVLLVGHGSQSSNNAQAAALDCGACCGQPGEVNARVLARLLNEQPVRARLADQGLAIPPASWFVAALHNTTTDEIEGFDLDLLPPAARSRWEQLTPTLRRAADLVRRERAPRLGLDAHAAPDELLRQLRRRANDGAQTRPEWGLTGNAALIIAPRVRSQAATFDGRCFLHHYDARHDPDASVLESLMTAPMLVAHWINWQYHASTCDPEHYGSGNKALHNVVGGRIGVFEGNGGDLRIGLARQSLHNGERWVHEPLRLTVVIDAPAAAIEQVVMKHEVVRQLLDNGWMHLWRWVGDESLGRYERGEWVAVPIVQQPAAQFRCLARPRQMPACT